jgi:integrase
LLDQVSIVCRRRHFSPRTEAAYRYWIRLIRARDEWEWIDRTPKVKLFKEGPGRERSITVEQVARLIRELPSHQRDVVIFALATGLRQSNVLGLEWSRVDLEAGHAWVGADQSKNRKPIAVPLNMTA